MQTSPQTKCCAAIGIPKKGAFAACSHRLCVISILSVTDIHISRTTFGCWRDPLFALSGKDIHRDRVIGFANRIRTGVRLIMSEMLYPTEL
jgi:hypothetical protein